MTALVRRRFAAEREAAASIAATPAPVRDEVFHDSPFTLKDLTPAYVAFCAYIFAITTFRLPIGTAAMATAVLTLPMERTKFTFPRVVVFAFALVAWAFVGWGTTDYPEDVADQILDFVKICAVVLVAVNVLTTRARLRMFLVWSMIAFFLYPVRGTLLNYFLIHETMQGRAIWNATFANPNDLAGVCLMQLACVLGVIETEGKRWVRYLGITMAGLLPLIIILTQSRGAFIASAAFAGIVVKRNWSVVRNKIPLVVAFAVLIVIIAPDQAFRRFATLANGGSDFVTETGATEEDLDSGSAEQRLLIWQVAGQIIIENPIAGVGLGAYNKTHRVYARRPEFLGGLARGARDTHSTYLNIMAELGIVGLLFFLGIIYETVKAARSSQKMSRTASPRRSAQVFYLEVGLYGYLVAGIWGTYGKLIPTYVYIATMYAAARVLREDVATGRAVAAPEPTPTFARRGMMPVLGRRG